jgi:excisionase family DNA binding protein
MHRPLEDRRLSEVDRILRDLRALHLLGQEDMARVLPELEHARARLWLLVMKPTASPLTQPSEPGRVLLTVKEAAAQLRFSSGHVYELVRSGNLRAIRAGRTVRISREALVEWRTAHEADHLDVSRQNSGKCEVRDEPRADAAATLRPDRALGRRGRPPVTRSG